MAKHLKLWSSVHNHSQYNGKVKRKRKKKRKRLKRQLLVSNFYFLYEKKCISFAPFSTSPLFHQNTQNIYMYILPIPLLVSLDHLVQPINFFRELGCEISYIGGKMRGGTTKRKVQWTDTSAVYTRTCFT